MKTRNLTISDTFNDFALQTEDINYGEEDLVSYCLENTSVFYWLNIESVWGPVGFQWDAYEDRGHFEVNPVKFTVLPKIPDPHRMRSFRGLFANLKSSTPMTIVHNTWENIDTLGTWNHPDVIIGVDSDHKFIKISSTNSSSNAITNEGYYTDKITIKGGDYSRIQDIGQRVLVYDGEDLNLPLLTLFNDYPENTENKYQFMKTFVNGEGLELSADNFIQTNKNNWQITTANEYIPSIYLTGASDLSLNVDLRPFVKDSVKLWHTLFSNFSDITNIHVKNSLSSHTNTVGSTDDMYMLFGGGIGDWDSNTFTYEGDEFNLPIYKSGIEVTQTELESIPDKYNLFTNPNHKCRYWTYNIPYYPNTYSMKYADIQLKQGFWLKGSTLTDITKPLKFNADASLLSNFDGETCNLTLDVKSSVSIDTTSKDAEEVIQQAKSSGSLCTLVPLNKNSYEVLLTDITYSQSNEEKAELFEVTSRMVLNKGTLYYMPLNDSYKSLKNLMDTNRNTVLSQDLTIPGRYNLIVLKNSPYKVKLPEDKKFNLLKLYISDTTIQPFIEIPKLKYPINDPDNYEYNHKIAENYKFNFQSEALIDGVSNTVRLENRQPYFLNYAFNNYAYKMINTYLYSKYSNTFEQIPESKQRLCTMRLTDLIAVDYPDHVNFDAQAWFVDESDMADVDKLKELKKEKIDEFFSKIMLNPQYKGEKDKSRLYFSAEQYSLFDKSQIETLVEYGYAIERPLG